jgi:hypothetical protein
MFSAELEIDRERFKSYSFFKKREKLAGQRSSWRMNWLKTSRSWSRRSGSIGVQGY